MEVNKPLTTAQLADWLRTYGRLSIDNAFVEYKAMAAADRLEALEAKIDALMLEYCPDEMTPEQLENWGNHQTEAQELKCQ